MFENLNLFGKREKKVKEVNNEPISPGTILGGAALGAAAIAGAPHGAEAVNNMINPPGLFADPSPVPEKQGETMTVELDGEKRGFQVPVSE